jgi:hypothetical protein
MTMAYRVTIKITKTDTNQWCFLEPTPDMARDIAEVTARGLDLSQFVCTPQEAVFTKDFDDKTSCNRFIVMLMAQNSESISRQVKQVHQGWKEEITTEEI